MNAALARIRHVTKTAKLAKPVAAPAILPDGTVAKMHALAKLSLRRNTRKAYASDLQQWETWAAATGNSAWPANPVAVAGMLADRAETHKLASLSRLLASISAAHTRKGLPFDRDSREIRAVVQGVRKSKAAEQRQVSPMTADVLKLVLTKLDPTRLRDVRDKALLMLGVATGLRRSEICALDWLQAAPTEGEPTLTGALEAVAPERMLVSLRHAKTGTAEAQTVTLANAAAIAAIQAWVKVAGVEPGTPLFRQVDRHSNVGGRMGTEGLAQMLKQRVKAAGLDPVNYSGHSLRRGMLTTAARQGVDIAKMKRAARHKSEAMTRRYVETAEQWADDVSGSLDLGG